MKSYEKSRSGECMVVAVAVVVVVAVGVVVVDVVCSDWF